MLNRLISVFRRRSVLSIAIATVIAIFCNVAVIRSVHADDAPAAESRSAMAPIRSVGFSPDGKLLAAAVDRHILVWSADGSDMLPSRFSGAEFPVLAVAFSPDGKLLVGCEGEPSVEGRVLIWNLNSSEQGGGRSIHQPDRVLTGHTDCIYAVSFHPDSKHLVTGSYDKLCLLWDLSAGEDSSPLSMRHHTGAVFDVEFFPDGSTIASVAADQTLKLWRGATGERIYTASEATKGLAGVAVSPDSASVATVGVDKVIRVYDWNGTAAKLRKSAFAHDAGVLGICWSSDGQSLFTTSEDGSIKAWDSAQLRERAVVPNLPDWPISVAVSRVGTTATGSASTDSVLAVGLFNGELQIFNAADLKHLRTIEIQLPANPVNAQADAAGVIHAAAKSTLSTGDGAAGGDNGGVVVASAVQPDGQNGGASSSNAPSAAPATIEPPKPNPPTPRLDFVSPRTIVRGQTLKLVLGGQNISAADRVECTAAAFKARLLPPDPNNANAAVVEIDVPADWQPGEVFYRLHTPLGSTASRSNYVGPFAEVNEAEPNDVATTPTVAAAGSTCIGTIATRGDVDYWAIDFAGAADLVCVAVTSKIGSTLSPRLTLLDASGKTLAASVRGVGQSDCVVGVKQAAAGRYILKIEDRNYTGGGGHVYAIHCGPLAYVTEAFPLGLSAISPEIPTTEGVEVPAQAVSSDATSAAAAGKLTSSGVLVSGFNIPADSVVPRRDTKGTSFHHVVTPVGPSFNAVRFESSAYPEYVEAGANNTAASAQPISVPSAVSGRISGESHDVDCYTFVAKKNEPVLLEVFARRLGSPLDSFLSVLHEDGSPVQLHTLRAVAETYTVLRDHDSRGPGIRLQNWEDLQVDDYVQIGGEVLKLKVLPLGPDEDTKFWDRNGVRLSYFGTTPQAHALNAPAYKVEIHPPGAQFPPNGMPVTRLVVSNDDGGPEFGSDSRIVFNPPEDGRYVVAVNDVRGLAGHDFTYRLSARFPEPDFRISLDPENPNIPRGGALPVTVNVTRLDGFAEPVDVRLEGLPAGIAATTCRVPANANSGIVLLTAAADAPVPSLESRAAVRVIGVSKIGEKNLEHSTSPGFGGHELTITSPPDLAVRVEPEVAEISPGEERTFTVHIERRNSFTGRVPVDVLNLPHGVRVLDVGLNGVLVTEDTTSRSFVVKCDPWAEPGTVQMYAAGKVEAKNERHSSSVVQLNVRAASKPVSAAATPTTPK